MGQIDLALSAEGLSLTRIRRHVFEVLLMSRAPVGAYEILETLQGVACQKPPTVYRALDWLEDHGLVLKIRSVAKYLAVTEWPMRMPIGFAVCSECGATERLVIEGEAEALFGLMQAKGFAANDAILEIVGLCEDHVRQSAE
jgi:Fur family transcriptional regulator, zinc uptake regulator